MSQLDQDLNQEEVYECIAILNSFLIDLPEAINLFAIHNMELKNKIEKIMMSDSIRVVDIVLRLSRNLLNSKLLENLKIPKGILSKVRDIDLVASLAQFVDSEDTDVVTRLLNVLCKPNQAYESCVAKVLNAFCHMPGAITELSKPQFKQTVFDFTRYPNQDIKLPAIELAIKQKELSRVE